jgi:hypothetical protein
MTALLEQVCCLYILMVLSNITLWGQSPVACRDIVGTLITQFVFQKPASSLARVEIRQCQPSENLQIVAWETDGKSPALVVDTTDFTIVQAAARRNVFVIETTGGSRDRVYVIVYQNGKPKVELMQVTRGSSKIELQPEFVETTIFGIYAGDAPPRTVTRRFELK